jgi:hypothetical protein
MLSKKIAALAAASLLSMSSAAVAQTAAPLSVAQSPAVERAGADVAGASELRGTTGWIIGAIALGLLIWGAIELLDNDDPSSP